MKVKKSQRQSTTQSMLCQSNTSDFTIQVALLQTLPCWWCGPFLVWRSTPSVQARKLASHPTLTACLSTVYSQSQSRALSNSTRNIVNRNLHWSSMVWLCINAWDCMMLHENMRFLQIHHDASGIWCMNIWERASTTKIPGGQLKVLQVRCYKEVLAVAHLTTFCKQFIDVHCIFHQNPRCVN